MMNKNKKKTFNQPLYQYTKISFKKKKQHFGWYVTFNSHYLFIYFKHKTPPSYAFNLNL